MRSRSRWLPRAVLLTAVGMLGACIAVAPTGIHRQTDDGPDAGAGGSLFVEAGPPPNPEGDSSTPDPHAAIGADPAHGPFRGGQRVLVRGKGFSSKARVWFGATEVDETQTLAVDPTRVQVAAPPGTAGQVDISVQNGDDASTKRTLAAGYTYDALYAEPDSGPIPGGTVIEIIGQGTQWDASTVAKIDQKPCTALTVDSPTLLRCTVPAGSPGSKTISVTTGAETILVLDAYTYADSANGYKGGLSGQPLAGELKVLVYDNFSGDPIPGALVVVGDDMASALQGQADGSGVVVIHDGSLTKPTSVTVAAKCHSPISFVAEPVDTVTAYLDPVLDPACGSAGDPPPVGGKPGNQGAINGELVWQGTDEFKKANWTNVPVPIGPNEHLAAYVFVAAADPTYPFQLPSPTQAVTTSSPGDRGYGYSVGATAGNRSIYAIAGIEDDTVSPPRFTGYVMGAVNGIPVVPGEATVNVYIPMTKTLDQALIMSVSPPAPGPKGPDRLLATVAVRLGADGYALLPAGRQTPALPVSGNLSFVGVPGLDGDLAGSVYVTSAKAQTGPSGTAPMSVIAKMLSTSTSQVVYAGGFVGIPQLVTPSGNAAWDGSHLEASFPPGLLDLTVYDIQSGNGLVHWLIAVPGSQPVTLPDLRAKPELCLPPGPLNIAVYGARIDGFDYKKLRYRDLRPSGMSAYSLGYFDAHL